MRFQMDQAVEILRQTPAVLNSLLKGKSAAWFEARSTSSSFSPVDVLGHLIEGERTDWIPRVRIILEHGGSMAFEPFDRFAFKPWIGGKTVDELLDEFASLRSQSLEALAGFHLQEADFDLPGLHPELGPVKLRHHLSAWVVHDLGHIAQIVKAMAVQYRDEVGPWRAFVSILD